MKPAKAPDIRKRELAMIHMAKAALGLDEETYRAMLWVIARVTSAGDLDWSGRKRVLDHLKAKGWKGSKHRAAPAPDKAPMIAKIRALLINHPTGPKSDGYADGIAKRMFGIERLEWCDHVQLHKIVQALSVSARRAR